MRERLYIKKNSDKNPGQLKLKRFENKKILRCLPVITCETTLLWRQLKLIGDVVIKNKDCNQKRPWCVQVNKRGLNAEDLAEIRNIILKFQ